MGKFDIRFYDEESSNKETRKDQKIKHQIYDRRTGRIPREEKSTPRVVKQRWAEDAEG